MSLKVIGAGFGRTGTLSLKLALEQLGFGPCYHMIETGKHPEHDAAWLALANGETNDWDTVLAGYQSTVDWPGVSFWKTLAKANPDAKLILTVRDPARWYESANSTIFARMRATIRLLASGKADDSDRASHMHMRMVEAVVSEKSFGGNFDRDHAIKTFIAHNEDVRRSVSPERLLVYQAGDGWPRLCDFLGVPVPKEPYPHVNSTADFKNRFPPRS